MVSSPASKSSVTLVDSLPCSFFWILFVTTCIVIVHVIVIIIVIIYNVQYIIVM